VFFKGIFACIQSGNHAEEDVEKLMIISSKISPKKAMNPDIKNK
jgi:hypothetical protein